MTNSLITRYDQNAQAEQQGRIIETIKLYQAKHRGLSPTDQMIAKEIGLSPGQVSFQIRRLEDMGKLFIASHWPRSIVWPKGEEAKDENPRPANETKVSELRETGVSKPALEKEEKMEKMNQDNARRGRTLNERLPFRVRAKQIAEALLELEKSGKKGGVIGLSEMVYGFSHTGNTSRVVSRMAEEGWVWHRFKKQNDISLTLKGKRELLGMNIADDGHELSASEVSGKKRWEGVPREEMLAHMARIRELAAASKRKKKELSAKAREEMVDVSEAIMPELTERQKLDAGMPFNPGKALEEAVFSEPGKAGPQTLQQRESDNIMVPVNPRKIVRSLSDLDLVLELSERGYRVTR